MRAQLVIFDDGRGSFGPLTDRRSALDLRTGIFSNLQRVERVLQRKAEALFVPSAVAAVTAARHPSAHVNPPSCESEATYLLLNGRAVVTGAHREGLDDLRPGRAIRTGSDEIVAICLQGDDAQRFVGSGFEEVPTGLVTVAADPPRLLTRPWQILDALDAALRWDLEEAPVASASPPLPDVCVIGASRDEERVLVGEGATIGPGAVIDARKGEVAIDAHAVIGPLAVLEGPCYIGAHSVVTPHAYIRPHTVIGARCKVAGEISASIVGDCTNKAHYGYLGNAIVGEWVNLGAGTTVSNLKNTYGEVRMQLTADTPPEPTGRAFLGPVIGDFVRTAIGTRIPTGSCIGTGAMLATSRFSPKFVPAGRFITDAGDEPADVEKLLSTVREMMSRRQVALSPDDEALLRELLSPV